MGKLSRIYAQINQFDSFAHLSATVQQTDRPQKAIAPQKSDLPYKKRSPPKQRSQEQKRDRKSKNAIAEISDRLEEVLVV